MPEWNSVSSLIKLILFITIIKAKNHALNMWNRRALYPWAPLSISWALFLFSKSLDIKLITTEHNLLIIFTHYWRPGPTFFNLLSAIKIELILGNFGADLSSNLCARFICPAHYPLLRDFYKMHVIDTITYATSGTVKGNF